MDLQLATQRKRFPDTTADDWQAQVDVAANPLGVLWELMQPELMQPELVQPELPQ